MPTGFEVTACMQPQAFRCTTCGGLLLEDAGQNPGSKPSCPCGGIRLTGGPYEVVAVTIPGVETSQALQSQPPNDLVQTLSQDDPEFAELSQLYQALQEDGFWIKEWVGLTGVGDIRDLE